MNDLELFSTPLCPFAHCVRLVLAEKQLAYQLTDIDLQNKPSGFLKISPDGKVPVLRHGTAHVCRSAIINEYLEEQFAEVPLLPRGPAERARARFWIEFANSRLFAVTASLLYGAHRLEPRAALDQITAALRLVEADALTNNPAKGPYWLGPHLSLVDLTFYPWFEQLAALEHLRNVRLPPDTPALTQWREAVAQRNAVQAIAKPPQYYVERYAQLDARLGA